ncbi:MAG: PcfJ domain-containing protein [Tissierellales bacterium]|nr:PcfJ domain-containing protein [Tissierellales bacterium]
MKKSKLIEIKDQLVDFEFSSKEYGVKAKIVEVDESLLLLLLIKVAKSQYYVFLGENDYITYEAYSGKWKTAGLSNILDYSGSYKLNFTEDARKVIDDYYALFPHLKESFSDVRKIIFEHQAKIRKKRLDKKHDRIRARIDKVMDMITPPPPQFIKWIDEVAHYKSRYIFYKNGAGYCSVCHNEVLIRGEHKHNAEGKCPKCHADILYKAIGYSKNIYDYCTFTYLQKTKDGFFIRIFTSKKDYSKDIKNPEITYFEIRRYYVEGENIRYYHYGNFFNVETRWCDGAWSSGFGNHYFSDDGPVYTRNLTQVLAESHFQYSGLQTYIKVRGNKKIDVEKYLHRYYRHPVIEKLLKADLLKLVEQIIWLDRDIGKLEFKQGMRLHEYLEISKIGYNMLRAVNGTADTVDFLKVVNQHSMKLELSQLKWIQENHLLYHITEILKYTSITKAINYLKKAEDQKYKLRLDTWKDYIELCHKLKYDLKDSMTLYPRHLKKRHDEALLILQEQNIVLCDQYLKQRYERTEMIYGYKNRKLLIVAPRNRLDIIREGEALTHCVRSKVESAALGKTTILFIRREENKDKPYYTLEVSNTNRIVQCYGYNNCDQTEEIKQLLSDYEAKVLSKLK